MLDLHMARGMDLSWLKEVYVSEERGFGCYRWERTKGVKSISVADKTKKKLFSSKTMPGGKALWLPYIPGEINYTTSRGMDVISGPFSGCIMAAYNKREGGGRRVCHVSTFGESKYDCKESWEEIKSGCTSYVSFRPHECARGLSRGQLKKVGNALVFGIITGDNRCYGVLVTQSLNGFIGGLMVKMTPEVGP